jgi:hypothetical protein
VHDVVARAAADAGIVTHAIPGGPLGEPARRVSVGPQRVAG